MAGAVELADPERADGTVRATKPLYTQGRIIHGLDELLPIVDARMNGR